MASESHDKMDSDLRKILVQITALAARIRYFAANAYIYRSEIQSRDENLNVISSDLDKAVDELSAIHNGMDGALQNARWDDKYSKYFQFTNLLLLLTPTIIGFYFIISGMNQIARLKAETSTLVRQKDSLIVKQKDSIDIQNRIIERLGRYDTSFMYFYRKGLMLKK